MKKLAIVVPVYNEEEVLELFVNEVNNQTRNLPLEKIFYFVDDGSKDGTLEVLKRISSNKNIRYIYFSRNFGKEAALLAGLKASEADFITVMDVDLQDPPEMLNEMYKKILDGYDIVGTRRVTRDGEPIIRSFFARIFYKLINKISSTEMVDGARDFRLMTRQVVDNLLLLRENNRFSKGLFSWLGFKVTYLEYENRERVAGHTSWNFLKLFRYSIDGIVNFSEVPLSIATYVGFLSFIVSIILSIFFGIKTVVLGDSVQGFPTLVILLLLLGGLQLLSLGIIGKYIAKIFLETKKRPNYIIKESNF